jgi:hypothetical protein
MIELTDESSIGSWTCPNVPLTIEYLLDKLEELRLVACDEQNQLSRDGQETAGVLFGRRHENTIRILTWRPITRETKDEISTPERSDFTRLLESAATDPVLKGMAPLGWFKARVRGGIAFTPADVELYNSLFPESWQIALVLEPGRNGLARAGFFARPADGSVKPGASQRELVIEPGRRVSDAPSSAAAGLKDSAAALETPSFRMQGQSFGGTRWLWVFPVLLALGVVAFLLMQKPRSSSGETFSLRVDGAGDNVEISWDRDAAAVRDATRAVIEVRDGSATSQIKLTADQVRSGSVHYLRLGRDVGFGMTIYPSSGPELREFARLVVQESSTGGASSTSEAEMQLRAERDALKGEVARFKEQARQERERADTLKDVVRILRERLKIDTKSGK